MSFNSELTALDRLVSMLVGLGVPGLILLVAMGATGSAGAPALTTALIALGGPGGAIAGISVLVLCSLISAGLANFGFRKVFEAMVLDLLEKGISKQNILERVACYSLTRRLTIRLIKLLETSEVRESPAGAAPAVEE